MIFVIILVVAALAFAGYAFITKYSTTTGDFPTMAKASFALAAAAIGAAVTQWLHSATGP